VPGFHGTPGVCQSGKTGEQCAPGAFDSHQNFFRVEHYNTTNLVTSSIPYLTQGAWSNTLPGVAPTQTYTLRAAQIGAGQGYIVDSNAHCSVYAQCDKTTWGWNANCPISSSIDIALIFCPDRAIPNWAPLASTDGAYPRVEVWWFHELLYLARQGDSSSILYQPSNNFAHYGALATDNEVNNYHYFQVGQPLFQLFPLVSKWDANGATYRDLGRVPGSESAISAPICHGTSGSGVFQVDAAGNHFFLGPMLTKGAGWTTATLCDDPRVAHTTSDDRSEYDQLQFTKQMANLPVAIADRSGHPANP
jgi:hypothetical protein